MSAAGATKRALLAAFIANGLGGPSFLARLPERQQDLGLSDAALGATVVGMAFGALLASAPAAWVVHHIGSRRTTVIAGVVVGSTLWLTAMYFTGSLRNLSTSNTLVISRVVQYCRYSTRRNAPGLIRGLVR